MEEYGQPSPDRSSAEEKEKTPPSQPPFGESYIHYLFRVGSHWLVDNYLLKTPITPNQITLFRTGILLLTFPLFWSLNLFLYFIGVLLFQFSEMLDSVDGDLARKKGLQSARGVWLEIFLDSLFTPVWGGIGLLFAGIAYKATGDWRFFLLWGLVGFSANLEKNFYLHFKGGKGELQHALHNHIYFGLKGEEWKIKFRNFIIISKMWENQWLVWGGLFYILTGVEEIWWGIWIWLLLLNQIHWIRLAWYGYKKSGKKDGSKKERKE